MLSKLITENLSNFTSRFIDISRW